MENLGVSDDPAFYKKILDNIRDGVYLVDRDRRIQYWNGGAQQMTGYAPSEVVGRCCQEDILCHIDRAGHSLCRNGCPLAAGMDDGAYHEENAFLRHKEGRRIPVRVRVQPMFDAKGNVVGAVEIFSDNTAENEIRRRIESLRRLAFLDALTELPNRRFLDMTLDTVLNEFAVYHDLFGILMIDIDDFKSINDTYGHIVGDTALREIARSMVAALRPVDTLGRWGGDEFLAIVCNVNATALGEIAERAINMVRQTAIHSCPEARLGITVSIGAALVCTGDSAAEIVRRADKLLYASKKSGRDLITFG